MAITIALRTPTLRNSCGPAADGDHDLDDELARLRERCASGRRGTRRSQSGGCPWRTAGESSRRARRARAAGRPPATRCRGCRRWSPALRICGRAHGAGRLRQARARRRASRDSMSCVQVTPPPSRTVSPSTRQRRSSSTRRRATTSSGRRWPKFTSTMKSVPPASTCASGCAASASSASSSVAGLRTAIGGFLCGTPHRTRRESVSRPGTARPRGGARPASRRPDRSRGRRRARSHARRPRCGAPRSARTAARPRSDR